MEGLGQGLGALGPQFCEARRACCGRRPEGLSVRPQIFTPETMRGDFPHMKRLREPQTSLGLHVLLRPPTCRTGARPEDDGVSFPAAVNSRCGNIKPEPPVLGKAISSIKLPPTGAFRRSLRAMGHGGRIPGLGGVPAPMSPGKRQPRPHGGQGTRWDTEAPEPMPISPRLPL